VAQTHDEIEIWKLAEPITMKLSYIMEDGSLGAIIHDAMKS
jgi:hypothetical protein